MFLVGLGDVSGRSTYALLAPLLYLGLTHA